MAKQLTGFIVGTFDDLTFYKMDELYYVRMKSSLTGKRFRKDSCFEGSRRSSSRFALGNRLASVVYRSIDPDKRKYPLFCFLKRRSIILLKKGMEVEEARFILECYLKDFGIIGYRADDSSEKESSNQSILKSNELAEKISTKLLIVLKEL